MTEPDNGVPWKWQLIVAVVLLALFLGLAVWMLLLADSSDAVWKNRAYVFGSVEAIVFTAVGWLFGREVNRAQAETAQESADKAREVADQKTEEAGIAQKQAAVTEERGRGLVDGIGLMTASPPAPTSRGGDIGLGQGRAPAGTDSQLEALHELGRRLFPARPD